MAKKKLNLPFDKVGGVVAIQRRLLESENYLKLPAQAKVLITLLQIHWDNFEYIDYGIREAMEKIPCSKQTAIKTFKVLQERGFIVKEKESIFNSREKSYTRGWRLTWMPFDSKPPSREWNG